MRPVPPKAQRGAVGGVPGRSKLRPGKGTARKLPTVPAQWSKNRKVWVVVCPHCRREHLHGPQPGPRTSDCSGPGYIVAAPKESK
jgi:hypothetical protein